MIDAFIDTLEFFPRGLVYVGLGIIVLVLAKLARDLVTSYSVDEQIIQKKNIALGLTITGYYLGVIIVFVGTVFQPLTVVRDDKWQYTTQFGWNVLEVFLYSLAGIVLLNLSRLLVDRLVLYKFEIDKEIIEDQNVGAAAVVFGTYIASGLVIAASIAGTGGGSAEVETIDSVVRSLAFFGLGMVVLVLFSLFYELTTSFSIHDQIEGDNSAVGVALGGNLVAVGIIAFKALFGEFVGWGESLAAFLTFAVIGFALLYVVRLIVDFALLPGTRIAEELAENRNVAVAFIESGVLIGAALILYFAI